MPNLAIVTETVETNNATVQCQIPRLAFREKRILSLALFGKTPPVCAKVVHYAGAECLFLCVFSSLSLEDRVREQRLMQRSQADEIDKFQVATTIAKLRAGGAAHPGPRRGPPGDRPG